MKKLCYWLRSLFFPEKCLLCHAFLSDGEQDLCRKCRLQAPDYPFGKANPAPKRNSRLHFLDSFTAVWYYEGDVRHSILRYKFHRHRENADGYGRLLGMKIIEQGPENVDVLTWVPVSTLRKWKRGYDQSQLLCIALGRELNIQPVRTIKKIRNSPPQSGIPNAETRKANILGAYRVIDPDLVRNKKVLIVDDIFTTGATCEECARVLLTAGAVEVHCAAIASARNDK